jgi:hypothetical protein
MENGVPQKNRLTFQRREDSEGWSNLLRLSGYAAIVEGNSPGLALRTSEAPQALKFFPNERVVHAVGVMVERSLKPARGRCWRVSGPPSHAAFGSGTLYGMSQVAWGAESGIYRSPGFRCCPDQYRKPEHFET